MIRRKLSEAARELSSGNRRVTDIAFEYGFKDLETFTRAFRRELGTTPSAVRRGAPFPYLDSAEAARPGKAEGETGIVGAPELEYSAPCFLSGWSIRVCEQSDAVGRLWRRFSARASSVPHRLLPPRFRQLASWTEESEDGMDVMVGVEVSDLSELPVDLVGKSIPGSSCLVFTHRGSMARIAESYRAIYRVWLAGSDRRPTLPYNFERYPDWEADPYSDGYTMQICVPVA